MQANGFCVRLVAVGLAVAVLMTPAVAADIDPAWLAGTWEATAPSPVGGGKQDTFKLMVNPDGTFQENIQSARGGAVVVAGKWRVSGESAILEGTFNGGPYIIEVERSTRTVPSTSTPATRRTVVRPTLRLPREYLR